jgi:hypothetical protein
MQGCESVIRQAIIRRTVLSIFFIDYCAEKNGADDRRGADMTPVLLFVRA